MADKLHRGQFMANLEAEGKTIEEIFAAVKADEDYTPKHRDKDGRPLTLEAAIIDGLRAGMTPVQAVSAASTYHKGFQQNYYYRLRLGAAADLETIVAGKARI